MLVSTLDEFMAAEELHPHCCTLPSHRLSPRHNRLQMRVEWVWLEKVLINGCVGSVGGALSWSITLGVDVLLWLTEASMFLALGSSPFVHSSFFVVKKYTTDKGSVVSELDIWCNTHHDRSQAGLMLFCIKSKPQRVQINLWFSLINYILTL